MTEQSADRITLNRGQLAALLAHHADVIAARWDAVAPGAGAWEVAAAYSLRGHAAELTAEEETPAVRELLESILTCNAEQQPADAPSAPADRATIYRELADLQERTAATDVIRRRRSIATGRRLFAVELRRMADEAQQTEHTPEPS